MLEETAAAAAEFVKRRRPRDPRAESLREEAFRAVAAKVAHEVNNPLSIIRLHLAYVEHLFERGSPPSKWEFEFYSGKINNAVDRIAAAVRDVQPDPSR